MGKCLFPINEKGEDEIKEVILFPGKTADEISEQVKKWAYEIKDTYNLKIDDKDRYMGVDLVAFRGSVKLGLSVLSIDYAFAHIGDFARYASEIKFCCRVERLLYQKENKRKLMPIMSKSDSKKKPIN